MAGEKKEKFTVENGVLVSSTARGRVVIPSGVTEIADGAFCENNYITSVDLGDVKTVGERAFYFCRKLETVVGKKVVSVGPECFRFCDVLRRIEFGAVEKVGDYAFFSCGDCVEIVGTENLTEIGESSFESTKITELEISPNAVKIGASAFRCCSKLARFTVPAGIKVIEPCVFAGCGLKSVELPEGLERMEYASFFDCDRLKYIEIPSTVTFIEHSAFERCMIADIYNKSSLDIRAGKSKPGQIATHAVHVYSTAEEATREIIDGYVFCADNDGIPYLTEYVGSDTELVLPRDFHGKAYKIYKYAFAESNMTRVEFGDGVTDIGNISFYKCKNLKELVFGNGVKNIDRLAFKHCVNVREVTLGENVEIIGVGAFLDTGLKHIVFGASVREIRRSAFDYCNSFKRVYYKGTPEEFDGINISGGQKSWLKSMASYYSESAPTDKAFKYWRYADGKISEWN